MLTRTVARATGRAYVGAMSETPAFLDGDRPPVPDIVVARGVTPFFLPRRPVRGRLVRLGPLAHALLTRHPNHPAVTRLAGQSLALAAALSTALEIPRLVQRAGEGRRAGLDAAGGLHRHRRVARLCARRADEAGHAAGGGTLAAAQPSFWATATWRSLSTRDPTKTATRALSPSREATWPKWHCTTSVPASSLRCFVHLACEETPDGWRAGALVLEKIAGAGGIDPSLDDEAQEESWRTATTLAATLTDGELLDDNLPPERLLYRLFHSEGVATDRARALSYGCRCSRARLVGILEGFPPDDLDHMAVDGDIVMTCEFCNYDFRFARDDVRGRSAAS